MHTLKQTIQGHPRSLIGTNRNRVCDFLLVLSSPFKRHCRFSAHDPPLFHPNFGDWGCLFLIRSPMLGSARAQS